MSTPGPRRCKGIKSPESHGHCKRHGITSLEEAKIPLATECRTATRLSSLLTMARPAQAFRMSWMAGLLSSAELQLVRSCPPKVYHCFANTRPSRA